MSHDIPQLNALSVGIVTALINLRISPAVIYGIQLIWKLTENKLKKPESTDVIFLKRLLCVSKYHTSMCYNWNHILH
jgi:hypothetical protein